MECSIFECDGPGYLDDRIAAESGLRIVVVRSFAVLIRATAILGSRPVSSFSDVVGATDLWDSGGVAVVADTAYKFVAALVRKPAALVVFEAYENLFLPNCAELAADRVWIVKCSRRTHAHRGFAFTCFCAALADGSVSKLEPKGERPAPVCTRALFFDVRSRECDAVQDAIASGDTDVAIAAFPGTFESSTRESPGTGDCPICFEPPNPRITSKCCRRDFCLGCYARSMNDDVSSCPWCRDVSGMFNCSIECGHAKAPLKDVALMDVVGDLLVSGDKVLVVTTDDSYLIAASALNPLRPYMPVMLSGGAKSMTKAVDDFQGRANLAIARADKPLVGCVFLPATAVVFTELSACADADAWMATCRRATRAVRMVSVVDAPHVNV